MEEQDEERAQEAIVSLAEEMLERLTLQQFNYNWVEFSLKASAVVCHCSPHPVACQSSGNSLWPWT